MQEAYMSNHPAKGGKRDLRKHAQDAPEVTVSNARSHSWVSFHYSFTEISAFDGRARVKCRNTRLEDGTLTTERFEGVLDRQAYAQVISRAQHYVVGRTARLLQSFASSLPFSKNHTALRD